MSYRIEQSSEYMGRDYWRWSAWIEGSDAELDAVDEVVWLLHPTFEPSRVKSSVRADKFRLNTAGWGTFLLRAELKLKSGEKRVLKRQLRLETGDESAAPVTRAAQSPSKERKPVIFLSYSAEDSRKAARLRDGFTSEGFEVLDQTSIAPGEPLKESLQKMIIRSDAVIGIVEDEISPWVRAELEAATHSEKPVLAVLTPHSSSIGIPDSAQRVEIERPDASTIAHLLRHQKD